MQKISLFVILSVLLTMPMAFGQEETLGAQVITLTADNTAYQEGDVITITGSIEKVIPGMPATLQVFFEISDPNWLGIDWNPMILIIFISLIGGIYTFFSRFIAATGDLKELDKQEPLTNTKSTSLVAE